VEVKGGDKLETLWQHRLFTLLIIQHKSYLISLVLSLPNLIGRLGRLAEERQSRKKELDYPVNPPKAEYNDNHWTRIYNE
jgi:hypothetical protein